MRLIFNYYFHQLMTTKTFTLTSVIMVVILIGFSSSNNPFAYATGPSFEFEFGEYGTGPGQFISPFDVETDSQDRIIVTDTENHRIQIFDSEGNFIKAFGEYGFSLGQLRFPNGVTTNSQDRIIVADTSNNRIQVFDSNGIPQFHFGASGTDGSGPGPTFNSPFGVATDSQDRIITQDDGNHLVRVFDSNGVFQFMIGGFGIGPGQFQNPRDVETDSQDRIIVVDDGNYRIQIFDSEGNFIKAFGEFGTGPGQFVNPWAITVDSQDNILIADDQGNRILVFDSNGNFLYEFGELGSASGQFDRPVGLATDSQDRIMVSERNNNRIQVFSINSPPIAVAGGPYLTEVNVGVILDGSGSTDAENNINTYQWDLNDDELTFDVDATGVNPSVTFTEPGIYPIALKVTDEFGESSVDDSSFVVVFDPNGDFVTASGRIDSPAGSYVADTGLSGDASFGFNSKYEQGASIPTGHTQFKFQVVC